MTFNVLCLINCPHQNHVMMTSQIQMVLQYLGVPRLLFLVVMHGSVAWTQVTSPAPDVVFCQ